jgi:hypothetical protein
MKSDEYVGNKQERYLAFGLLKVSSLALLWAFLPELAAGPNQFSDISFHLAIIQQMHDAVQSGGSAFDFIFDGSPFGHALVRSYQSLPHLTMYAVYRALFEAVSLPTILAAFTIALAALLPWSFYTLARKLGCAPVPSAFAGALSVLVAEVGGYGMGMQNYSWGTHGIISQLWALVFVAPAIGYIIDYLRTGRHLPTALLLVFLGCGSHLLSVHLIGFTTVTAAAMLLFTQSPKKIVFTRLLLFVVGCGLVISYQLVTLIPDTAIIHQSVLEPSWKFASHGIKWTYTHLIDGTLFDQGRLPVLSVMLLLGAVLLVLDLFRSAHSEQRFYAAVILSCFGVWLSLLSGYEVWGWLFGSLPGLSSMHMHRFIVGVHIFGICMAARAFAEIFRQIPSRLVAVILSVVILYPALAERAETFKLRHSWIAGIRYADQEEQDLNDLLSLLRQSPRGWVYAGMARDWANTTKVAGVTPIYHRVMVAGQPALGMLFHPFGLAGDVMFEFDPLKRDRYDLFGVRYVIAPPSWTPPEFLALRKSYKQFVLYEYAAASPVTLAHLEFEGWGSKADAARFMTRWVSLGVAARGAYGEIVSHPSGAKPGLLFSSQHFLPLDSSSQPVQGRINESRWTQESVQAVVSLDEAALVVFKIGYHPRWELLVDGKRHKTLRVTPGFIGVEIPKGEHRLDLQYRPLRLRSLLFFLCLLLPFIFPRAPKRVASVASNFFSPKR